MWYHRLQKIIHPRKELDFIHFQLYQLTAGLYSLMYLLTARLYEVSYMMEPVPLWECLIVRIFQKLKIKNSKDTWEKESSKNTVTFSFDLNKITWISKMCQLIITFFTIHSPDFYAVYVHAEHRPFPKTKYQKPYVPYSPKTPKPTSLRWAD